MQASEGRDAITASENLLCYNRGPFRRVKSFSFLSISAQAMSSARQSSAAGKIQEEK